MQQDEYLFELAPLGPEDLLSRCGEGPGNWWGDVDEDCLRVDERGRVVLVDPDVYYEVGATGGRRIRKRDRVVYSSVMSEFSYPTLRLPACFKFPASTGDRDRQSVPQQLFVGSRQSMAWTSISTCSSSKQQQQ